MLGHRKRQGQRWSLMSDTIKIDAATFQNAFGVLPSSTAIIGVQDALDGREVYSEEGVIAVALVILNELSYALEFHEAAAVQFAEKAATVPAVMDGVDGHIEVSVPVPCGPDDVPIQPITLRTCRLARLAINKLRDVVGNHPNANSECRSESAVPGVSGV